ncbi:fibronectin type III domain-containing protein [Tenacibaculum singaporense]|uniref:fibronectin type III domain-containing protein n=1 Tax=Tenacibaculum singaporense TaxID=2358479 RepID=UPI000F67CBB4|nr:fibronectin type III domain-containing protein [Tenacibaculum singaporense]RSC93666.1 fibronectin type III domain-containing protein [Tenacibaculum singaporense]
MKINLNDSNIFKKVMLLFTVLISTVLYSQTYPVQVTPQLIPPYSLKISDYATTSSEKLYANILLTDVNEVGRRIRLKMYIEGQGLSITTRDVIAGETPIYLDGGINLRLSNLDLQTYFQLNNLVGITPGQYNAPLPNGGYDFCFEVYDYFTNRKLSSKSCTTVYLLQNDPPILNLPFKDNIVNATNPQNVLFTWTPRHSNASNVQYEFTLKELWDVQNPQANFLASVPFYQTNTYSTTLLIGPEAPQLLSGKIYGWQVRAFVSDGVNETSVFKNDGKSEIFWFKYLEDCKPPSFVISQALTAESVQVNWQSSEHLRYRIQYRKKGFGDDDWFEVNSYTNEGKIRNLEPATVYEFRVGGECTQLSGFAYSNIQEFTTPSNDEAAYYNCGLTPQINITNKEPLPKLGLNETFTAGDFPVTTREVTGSNGTFSGWGYITLPFLENLKEIIDAANIATGGEVNIGKYTRIKVIFENVQVNSSYELTDGVVVTDYDPEWGGMIDGDEVIEDVNDLIDDIFPDEPEEDNSNTANGDTTTGENSTTGDTSTDNNSTSNTNNPDGGNNSNDSTNQGDNIGSGTSSDGTGTSNMGANDTNSSNNSSSSANEGLEIEYKNKDYKHKEVITIPYSRDLSLQTFILKNIAKDSTRIEWSLHKDFEVISAEKYLGKGKRISTDVRDIGENIVLQAEYWIQASDYPNGNSKKIRVQLKIPRKEFELEELVALHQDKRLAKSGEILYLLHPPTPYEDYKKVKYGIKINPKLKEKEIPKYNIQWSFDTNKKPDYYGKKTFTRNLRARDVKYVTTVNTGYPNKLEKSIDVKWIKEKKEVKSLSNKLKNFLSFFEVVNEVSEQAGKVMPCKAKFFEDFDRNLKMQWVNFNKEDKNSRHIIEVERFEFGADIANLATLECGKELTVSVFGYKLDIAKVYAKLGAGLNVSILRDKNYYYEGNKFVDEVNFSQGGVKITGEAGLKAGVGIKDENGKMIVGAEAGGKIDITGGGKIIYPYEGNADIIAGEAYINPLMYSFTATAKLGPLDKEFKFSDILWNIRYKKQIKLNIKTGKLIE